MDAERREAPPRVQPDGRVLPGKDAEPHEEREREEALPPDGVHVGGTCEFLEINVIIFVFNILNDFLE